MSTIEIVLLLAYAPLVAIGVAVGLFMADVSRDRPVRQHIWDEDPE